AGRFACYKVVWSSPGALAPSMVSWHADAAAAPTPQATRRWRGGRKGALEFLSAAPAVVSWGGDRFDIFGLGIDKRMYHKDWNGIEWDPRSQERWDPLGGEFNSQPTVVSWGKDRLDIFGLGTDNGMYHKVWDGRNWFPSHEDWENMRGRFNCAPTAGCTHSEALYIFGLGTNNRMFYKAYGINMLGARTWMPVEDGAWDPSLGGEFIPFSE